MRDDPAPHQQSTGEWVFWRVIALVVIIAGLFGVMRFARWGASFDAKATIVLVVFCAAVLFRNGFRR
jgi:ABC-type uncharacterized transport system permease subunit